MSKKELAYQQNSEEESPSILVVDDDEAMLRALRVLLSEQYRVLTVGGVEEAKDMIQASSFDLVISDYEMNDGSGYEVLTFVNEHIPHTPVIILTAYGTKERALQTINEHVFGFLEKPFQPNEIKKMVSDAIERRKSEKIHENFAKLGESAGHLVHEIANPMSVISSYIDIIKESAGKEDPLIAKSASVMEHSADRIGNIIRWTKSSLRAPHRVKVEIFEMREILDSLKEECEKRAQESNIPVVITPRSDVRIAGNKQQILEVLLNLVNNSFDAVDSLDEKWVMVDVQKKGDSVLITVTDSGTGIPEKVRDRLFTPLYTTKEGVGTGLGLAIVQKIVSTHGGKIWINDESPNTQFVVTLPALV